MSLNDLQKKIYKRGDENQDEDQSNDLNFGFKQKPIAENHQNAGKDEIKISELEEKLYSENISERIKKNKIKKKIFLWGGIAAAVLLAVSTAFLFYFLKNKAAFREKDIVFELEYPEEVVNGEQNDIVIKYGNYSRVNLKNVAISFQRASEIKIDGDNNSAFVKTWDLGVLVPGKGDSIKIPISVFGSEGSSYFIESTFQYVPENFNSIFKRSKSGKLKVGGSPVKIIISAPQNISSGRKIEYSVVCENLSKKDFSDLILHVDYPNGFSLETIKIAGEFDLSDTEDVNDGDILIKNLASGEKIEYVIAGSLTGDIGRGEIIKAMVGFKKGGEFYAYDKGESSTMIREPEILITQTVEKSVENANTGDIIYFKIKAKNTSDAGLIGVEVGSKLEGNAIDFSSVKVENGIIKADNTILWNSSGILQFAYFLPSQEVELSFSLRIKDRLPITNAMAKNFIVSSSPYVNAAALSEEIAGNTVNIKVNSKLVLTEKGFYWDDGKLKNSGPIPPRVGKTTTYTIHWQLLNLANDVKDAKVSAILPAGVGWSNSMEVTNGNLDFNNITRTVTWNIGAIPANVSIKLPTYEAVFQVSVNPAQADVGSALTLLGQAAVSGIDEFTGVELYSSVPAKTTELKEDGKLRFEDYKVSY